MTKILLTLALAFTTLWSCKLRRSDLLGEDNLNDPTLEPAYRAAMQHINAPFSIGESHIDPSGCLTSWLERLFGENYRSGNGEEAGLNLWNLTRVAATSNDSRARVKRLAIEIEIAQVQHQTGLTFENTSFLRDYRDQEGRVVLPYSLEVQSVPSLVRNFLILAKNLAYFTGTSRTFEENFLSRIEAGTIDFFACRADVKVTPLRAAAKTQIRGSGLGDEVRSIDFVYREPVAKQRLRQFQFNHRFQDLQAVPFVGSTVDLDPYLMPVKTASKELRRGDLIQFGRRKNQEIFVEATKLGIFTFRSEAEWPKQTDLIPVRLAKYMGDQSDGMLQALSQAVAASIKSKHDSDTKVQSAIDQRIAAGEDLSDSAQRQLTKNLANHWEVIIKSIRIINNGIDDLLYESKRLPYLPEQE